MAAITSALVTSIVIVLVCRPKIVWPMTIASHFLWVHPFWAFHHDYTIGILGWLLIGGENGFLVIPTIGMPFTFGVHYCLWTLLSQNKTDIPPLPKTESDGR